MTNTDKPRTAAATAAAKRNAEERRATMLRERGWICIPPEQPVCLHLEPERKQGLQRVEFTRDSGEPRDGGCE